MNILIPVQDAIFGDAITDLIAKHKWPSQSQFKLLTVIEYASYGEMLSEGYCCEGSRKLHDEVVSKATALLEEYARKLDNAMPGAFVQHQIQYGQPKDVILHEADVWEADMIVMGSHARKGFSRFMLGSVSSAVMSQSPCSVMIVKLPSEQHAPDKGEKTASLDKTTPKAAEQLHSHSAFKTVN